MLAAERRLKKTDDFSRVRTTGQKKSYDALLLFSAPGLAGHTRFGVSVAKKMQLNAVERNKVRRQISNILGALPASTPPLDVVVTVLRPAEFSEYKAALTQWHKEQSWR